MNYNFQVELREDGKVVLSKEDLLRLIGSEHRTVIEAERPATGTNPADLESEITGILVNLGVPRSIKGFDYLREAIILSVLDKSYIHNITSQLYPAIAQKFNTKAARAERAIRHAIGVSWMRGNVEAMNSLFSYTVNSDKGKPTNSEFIASIADDLRLRGFGVVV